MKKTIRILLCTLLILTLAVGFFACKKKTDPDPTPSVGDLAVAALSAAIPNGDNNDKLASNLLSLLEKAGLEEAETRAVLSALAGEEMTKYAAVYRDLSAGSYAKERMAQYRALLSLAAGAVSPEVAGMIWYTAASDANETLPYTLEDCKKLSSLLLSETAAFGVDDLEAFLQRGYDGATEKQISTAMLSLAASLNQAIGISQGAKNYLYSLASQELNALFTESDLSDETLDAIEQAKGLLLSLLSELRDRYDLVLTYAENFLSAADARLLLGFPYERQESVVYYGYRYADWSKTEITKAEYEGRTGDYDEYLAQESTQKGFFVKGEFVRLSEEDILLTERVYRLNLAHRAYTALDAAAQTAFRNALPVLFALLTEEQGTLANLLNRPIIEDSGAPAATIDELLAALPAIKDFDATDGISDKERADATQTLSVFESYLHGYLPRVY